MSYSGKYLPSNPKKYKGNYNNIIYRSLWERKFMVYCDLNAHILEWSSEEIVIPYRSPLDGKVHRYYPDFYVKIKTLDEVKVYIVEVKPLRQTLEPKPPKRKTKQYLNEVFAYTKNQAKWKAAREWCADRRYEFKIITEVELKV
jgi:hypothetical protein